MDIKLDNDQFAQVIGKHILESMGPETRDKIITDAITALNKSESRGYGGRAVSPLQEAFETGVRIAVNQLVQEVILSRQESPLAVAIREKVDRWMEVVDHEIPDYDIDSIIAMGLVHHYRQRAQDR